MMHRILTQRSPRTIFRVRPRNLASNFGQFDDAGSSSCGFGSCRRHFFFQGCSITDYENDCISSKVSINSIHLHHQIRWSHTSATATDTQTTTTTTTTTTNDDDEKEEDPGEILYQNAMKRMEEAQALQEKKEQEKSKQMYEAWKKSQEVEEGKGSNNNNNNNNSKNRKSHGVKVVQTLVKETRKERRESTTTTTTTNDEKSLLSNMAINLLKEAANNYEHPEALIQLGNMALQNAGSSSSSLRRGKNNNGDKCDDDEAAAAEISKALDMFHRAGIAGSRVGWYNLGNLYWTGYPPHDGDDELSGGENNNDDSIDTTAASLSAAAATKEEEEEPGRQQILTPNIPKAMEAFKKAIELGDCDAMYFVGVHKMAEDNNDNNNNNNTASIQSGMDLIQRSADLGHNGAKYYMALLKLNGEPNLGIEPCSIEEFTMLLDDAIDAGNVDARFVRGHSYYYGIDGYPQSYKNALDDFLIAANEGHPDSCVSAGAMLHTGMGGTIQRNQRRAFELYQQAGELGSKEGWQNVVACYMTGEGVPKSLETARYIRETILKEEPLLE